MIINIHPGKTLSQTEKWTPDKFNQGFNPTATVEPGSVVQADLDPAGVLAIVNAANDPLEGRKNYLLNGSFDFWTRGVIFSAQVVSSALYYTADRWCTQINNARTIARVALFPGDTAVPGNTRYALRWQQTANAAVNPIYLAQRIEGVRSLSGQVATLSAFMSADFAGTIGLQLVQNFGTGGSPSLQVGTSIQNVAIPDSIWTQMIATFNVPSISGKTLGTVGNDFLEVRFYLPQGATFLVYFANAQLEAGAVATGFEHYHLATELLACQRYYERISSRLANGITTNTPVIYYKATKRAAVNPITLDITGDLSTPYANHYTMLDAGSAYQNTSHALATTVTEIDAEYY